MSTLWSVLKVVCNLPDPIKHKVLKSTLSIWKEESVLVAEVLAGNTTFSAEIQDVVCANMQLKRPWYRSSCRDDAFRQQGIRVKEVFKGVMPLDQNIHGGPQGLKCFNICDPMIETEKERQHRKDYTKSMLWSILILVACCVFGLGMIAYISPAPFPFEAAMVFGVLAVSTWTTLTLFTLLIKHLSKGEAEGVYRQHIAKCAQREAVFIDHIVVPYIRQGQ